MEMLWNLMPGETPKTELILGRMSEADICLLTGDRGNLLTTPVDFNTNNMLPTNMACLSKDILDAVEFVHKYKVKCLYGTVVTFNTAPCFVDYNKGVLETLYDKIPAPKHHNFVEVYEFLMSRHVKGIYEITFEDESSMDWASLQRYWFIKLDKMKNKRCKIITPDSFN